MERNKKGMFVKGHKGYKPWLGKKRKPLSKEHKRKTSMALMGKKKTKIHKQNISLSRKGSKNPSWKGGRRKDSSGYWLISKPEHPMANSNGNIFEHRLVMEKELRRYLRKDEIIHHIDFNPENNNLNNLYLTTSSKHSKLHRGINLLIKELLKEGLVIFNKKEGRYERQKN